MSTKHPLDSAMCGGDLLIGRSAVVCERGCPIHHDTPIWWLLKFYPERKIEHAPFKALLKDMKEGAKRLAELDRNETEAK